jgi:hypothetical protein
MLKRMIRIVKLRQLETEFYRIESFLETAKLTLFNTPRMLLRGEAGIGKTHLLCDYASDRIKANKNTLIFLGHEFIQSGVSNDPIKGMAGLLGFSTSGEFITALKKLIKSSDERVCLIVDAINEGDQVKWANLSKLYDIKGLSLIISLRNGYDYLVKDASKYIKINHTGFADIEWEAIPRFFAHYKLKLPDIPILDPEFKNPLFLKLFCESYAGSRKTPRGHGATHVFEVYIEKQSKKILDELGLKLPHNYLWKNVIKEVGIWMGANGRNRILRSKLLEIIKRDTNLMPHVSRLVQLMEHDGLLLKYPNKELQAQWL